MKINSDHLLKGVEYDAANRIKDVIEPKFIIMHYTAGYSLDDARNVFNRTVVAAHLTIDEDGRVLQMVPFNRGCNHAGPSESEGYRFLNNHSIGIEHVNIGFLRKQGSRFIDAYGNVWKGDPNDLVAAPNSRVGSGTFYWPKYSEAMIAKSKQIVETLLKKYPSIKWIKSHEEIDTRGWKTDPGPAFPMSEFIDILKGKSNAPDTIPEGRNMVEVTSETLNVRVGPHYTFDLATKWPLHEGQKVELIREQEGWFYVLINDFAYGWIHSGYTRKA